MTKKRGLGKGLESLIPEDFLISDKEPEFFYVGIEEVSPNPGQPRKRAKDDELAGLVESIRERGVLQPLVVRTSDHGYELIAGERRWRAAQLAGLTELPVIIIRDVTPKDSLEMALIENLQRKDLNPVEESDAYLRLKNEFKLSQEDIARQVGKDRSTVANLMRLARLPMPIREDLMADRITMGHARAYLGLKSKDEMLALNAHVKRESLSVRETERLVKTRKLPAKKRPAPVRDPQLDALAEELSSAFGTRVKVGFRGKKGKIEIEFISMDDLDRLIRLITG